MNTMRNLKLLFISLAMLPAFALASGGAHLDKAPDVSGDNAALQNGAKLFVNYCMGCHGLSSLRYARLMDIGLTKEQIAENLMFTTDKIDNQMTNAMLPAEAKKWFGVAPPDLSLVARARASEMGSGPDWLYTYLRSFYIDESSQTGWNNRVFDRVAMPHILFDMQGEQSLEDGHLVLTTPGSLSVEEYDKQVADLVGFLTWAAEPQAKFRMKLGFYVLAFLAVLFVVSYLLKKEYWKDVH